MQLGCVAEVNATNKLQVLENWQKDIGLSWKEVAYLGQFLFKTLLFAKFSGIKVQAIPHYHQKQMHVLSLIWVQSKY